MSDINYFMLILNLIGILPAQRKIKLHIKIFVWALDCRGCQGPPEDTPVSVLISDGGQFLLFSLLSWFLLLSICQILYHFMLGSLFLLPHVQTVW